jgi:hypothetical protein
VRRVALLICLVAASVFTSAAAAAAPEKTTFIIEDQESVLTGICPFNVTASSDIAVTQILHFDESGNLIRIFWHAVEQDTFSANGKTIVGEPYTFNIEGILDAEGNFIHIYASGIVSRLVLPNGTFFLSAGRGDFLNHPEQAFLITPDVGRSGNIAAFCAALS